MIKKKIEKVGVESWCAFFFVVCNLLQLINTDNCESRINRTEPKQNMNNTKTQTRQVQQKKKFLLTDPHTLTCVVLLSIQMVCKRLFSFCISLYIYKNTMKIKNVLQKPKGRKKKERVGVRLRENKKTF